MKGLMSFLSGAMMGSLVGATLALLFAPASGDQLRHQMQDRVRYIQDEMQRAAEARRVELERELAMLRSPRQTGE